MAEMGIVDKIKIVMAHPSEFFRKIKDEKGLGNASKYLAILSLVYVVPIAVLTAFAVGVSNPFSGVFTNLFGVGMVIFLYAISLVSAFVGSGVLHVFARILKGKGNFSATFKAVVYGDTPALLLGWIPLVSIVAGIYSLYLVIKGISVLHSVSMGRAFVIAFVLPAIVGLALALLIGVAVVSHLAGLSA